MTQTTMKMTMALIYSLVVGINFGIWQNSFNAGMLGLLITWLAFYFNGDD